MNLDKYYGKHDFRCVLIRFWSKLTCGNFQAFLSEKTSFVTLIQTQLYLTGTIFSRKFPILECLKLDNYHGKHGFSVSLICFASKLTYGKMTFLRSIFLHFEID